MAEWRYFAQRFDGNGNLGDFVDLNLPLQGVEIEEVLSGHNSLTASISPQLSQLTGSDGRPVFDEWGVCIWAESPSHEVYGGILSKSSLEGPVWQVECVDLSGVFIDMLFDGATYFVDVDPIDLFRWIWQWYQARPGCNLGVTADMTKSPILLGADYVQVEDFDQEGGLPLDAYAVLAPSSYKTNAEWVDKAEKKLHKLKKGWSKAEIRGALEEWLAGGPHFESALEAKIIKKARQILGEPPNPPDGSGTDPTPTVTNPVTYQKDAYKLNWYTNHDLSGDMDDLAAATPFDWHMTHRWSDEGDEADLQHHIRIGYPKLGRRLEEFRFVVGENINIIPSIDRDGEEYANEVVVLGNGEGAAVVSGRAYRPHPGRMRRTKTITDQSIKDPVSARLRAEQELARRAQLEDITEIVLSDHPHAPAGAVRLGDEILLEGDTGWTTLNTWVRVVGRRLSPDEGSDVTLSVLRTDRIA